MQDATTKLPTLLDDLTRQLSKRNLVQRHFLLTALMHCADLDIVLRKLVAQI